MLYRTYTLIAMLAFLIAGINPSPAVSAQYETAPSPDAPVVRLNSEGDEWILVDPNQVELTPPAPEILVQNEAVGDQAGSTPEYLPPADVALELSLDRAREAGPQAVLAFTADQSDPNHPLLQAAIADAQQELAAGSGLPPEAPNAPRVSINSGPCTYDTIQAAVTAATNGSTIRVSTGSYTETLDISGKTIVIEGGYGNGCTTLNAGSLTQVNANNVGGSVVDISSGSVLTLRNLKLTGGTSFGAGMDVLGSSLVTLNNTDVFGNNGSSGAGLYISGSSVLTYTNDSDIYNNISSSNGGGAIVYGTLRGFDSSSDIYSNSAISGGGIAANGGTVQLNNSDVVANTATDMGGGIHAVNSSVTLSNSVFVGETAPCCQSAVSGGGIYASGGQISLVGANNVVMNNTATGNGGGIYLADGATLNVTGSRVGYDSSAGVGNDATLGAGMYVINSTVNFSGQIINNIATNSGGGVYSDNSIIAMTNTTIGGTGANQHNQIGATGLNGAGLYLFNNTRATMDQTTVISNTLSNPNTGYAGGMYVRAGSIITMTNSSIQQHNLPSAFDGRGAGMYLYDGTATLINTQVISNTTKNLGGGLRMFGTSTLNLLSGSSLVNNKAFGGVGGAVAATNTAKILVKDSFVKNNTASSHGGAFYLDSGTLDFEGFWDVRFNSAGGNGGAVAVSGSGDVDFRATNGPGASLLAVNHANGHGGGLHIANTDAVTLHATSGYPIFFNTNSAGGNGGGAYSNSGAFFDVYGDVQASSNSAAGNGGVFFLGGGSRLWLDDYFNTPIRIQTNTADNGGAIYASNSPRVECDGSEFGSSNIGNTATQGSGGAIYLSGSTFTASNCLFRNNQAQAGNGGAIAAYTSTVTIEAQYPTPANAWSEPAVRAAASETEAPQATACDPLTRQCSSFYSNTATPTVSNGYGGAIFSSGSSLNINKTFLHRNQAQRGGAIYQGGAGATGVISTTLVYSNTSLTGFGAGIRVDAGSMKISDSTLANNVGGAGYSPGAVLSYLYNTIIWGNSSAAFGALTAAVCNIDQGGTAGPATNPLFIAPGFGENYQLGPSSPAIDACNSGLPVDLNNFSRPKGSKYDIGAYEGLRYLFLPLISALAHKV